MVESKTVAALLSPVEGTTRVLSRPNPADDETLVYRTCGQRKRVDVAGVRGRVYRPRGGKRWKEVNSDVHGFVSSSCESILGIEAVKQASYEHLRDSPAK